MKFSLCCASIQSFQLYFHYLNMIRLCKASEPSGPWKYNTDLWPVRIFTAVFSLAFWNNSPCCTWMSAWFLQAQLPSSSLHPDNESDMPVRWDMDWTPFSAPLDRESCWQVTAERQSSGCPFKVQRTLKGQHKQIWAQQHGPSHNYWRCNVPLIMIQSEEISYTWLLPIYDLWVTSREIISCSI